MPSPLKTIIYGDPGIGKTVLLGSVVDVPEMMPNLYIDWEGNTDSIESKIEHVEFDGKNVPEPIKDKLTAIRFYGDDIPKLKKLLDCLEEQRAKGELLYKSTVIDSATEIDYWSLYNIHATHKFSDRLSPEVVGWSDFRLNLTQMKNILYRFRNLPIHIAISCHCKFDEGTNKIYPSLNGQLKTDISGIFKQTGILTKSNDTRVLRFDEYGKYHAKDCSEGGKLAAQKITNPTFQEIYNLRYK